MSTSPSDDLGRAAELLEGLLTDAALRRRFRREPHAICAEYGLASVASELAGGNPLETLELRESRSSLAGALMAAAGEGAGVVDSMRQMHEHGAFTSDASRAVGHALGGEKLRTMPVVHHAPIPHPSPAAASGEAGQAASSTGGSGIFPALGAGEPRAAGGHNTLVLGVGAHHDAIAADPTAALADPSDTYPGDSAAPEAIAAWMARQAHKAGLPGELPVMASLVESNLHNDNYGDLDSLGFFQMRKSIWEGVYPGYENHPELQLKWFIDHALAVRSERIAAGDRYFGENDSNWGRWIAGVEQPAAQYRGRYQLRLDEARGLLHQAGPAAQAAGPPAGAEEAAAAAAAAGAAGGPSAQAVASFAEHYLGTRYQWGGVDPQTGFDCSGFVDYVYGHFGVHLPRVAADQFDVGEPVTRAHLVTGDGVFFRDAHGWVEHEGIYIGDGKFIHAPHTGDVVKISTLDEPWYAQRFAGGRRFVDLGDAATHVETGAGGEASPGGSGVFAALGPSQPDPPAAGGGNTVQFLPAVTPGKPPASTD